MAIVLAYTSPAIGHLYPMVPLLLELRRRGHDVHVRTLGGQVQLVRSVGLEAEAIDRRIEAITHCDFEARGAKAALAATARVFAARGRIDGPDLAKALDDVNPDLAIIDTNSWGAAFAAEAWGGPWATFSPYTPVLSSPGVPPFGPGFAPMRGQAGRARDRVLRRLVLGAVERTLLPGVNGLRAAVGLAPVADVDELIRKAPLMLVTSAKPFEYDATDWGPDVVMIGASPWEPPQEAPAWLAEIDRPIVLVTTSSEFQDDGVLVRTALAALADEPVFVVATMPAGLDQTLEVPANARVEQFVPHGALLERAAVAVTHGGMGATQKALARGIPVCVVPFGRDQLEVARRVEVSGSGTRLPARKLTPDRLRAKVREAKALREGARRVADGHAAGGGAAAGADAIERRLLGVAVP